MKINKYFDTFFSFTEQLNNAKIFYSLSMPRPRAITITANVPGEIWEIEFHEDGDIGVEVFKSRAGVEDEKTIKELFQRFTD